jgi:fumarate reductase subunit C
MSEPVRYTLYHPKWYRRPVSVWWWLQSWRYARFVLRELTSLAVAWFALLALWKVRVIATGPEAYVAFLTRLQSPFWVGVNAAALVFVLYHTVTWLNLAPKAMVVRMGGKRVPDRVIQAMNYLLWAAVSAAALWVLERG